MVRWVAELSFPSWVLKGIKCLIQRDNGGGLQEQEQQLPVTSHPAPVSAPAVPVSMLRPPAMFDPLLLLQIPPSPASPQLSPVAIPLGFQSQIMEGNISNPVPILTKHHEFMRYALEMAEIALKTDEVPVGCVFVHKGEIIGKGMNDTNRSLCGTRHAEFVALEHILKTKPPSIFQETDLYVTVEPCIMCASALRQLKIRAVYFGCLNDRFGGCVLASTHHILALVVYTERKPSCCFEGFTSKRMNEPPRPSQRRTENSRLKLLLSRSWKAEQLFSNPKLPLLSPWKPWQPFQS
ncbi:cytidine deaminase-like protein [Terfezia claveryi]|nr:cytidine deaminase-like protein [Terfezia claveryi]